MEQIMEQIETLNHNLSSYYKAGVTYEIHEQGYAVVYKLDFLYFKVGVNVMFTMLDTPYDWCTSHVRDMVNNQILKTFTR